MKKRLETYNNLRNHLKTGDIVLFSGSGAISNTIKIFSGGKWSHVGMVLRIPEYDFVCLWESTTLVDVKDLERKRAVKGVQLVPLSQRIQKYDGDIGIRKFEGDITQEDINHLMTLREVIKLRPYEENYLDLAGAALPIFADSEEDLSSLFCSELVVEALQAMRIMSFEHLSDTFSPQELAEDFPVIRGSYSEIIEL